MLDHRWSPGPPGPWAPGPLGPRALPIVAVLPEHPRSPLERRLPATHQILLGLVLVSFMWWSFGTLALRREINCPMVLDASEDVHHNQHADKRTAIAMLTAALAIVRRRWLLMEFNNAS